MKFVFLVEGDTEKDTIAEFLKRWLDPQLNQRVGIQVVRFQGYAEFVKNLVNKAHMFLDGPKQDQIIAVIGLLDLYGPEFPEHAKTDKERCERGVDHFQKEVNRDRFRMFFCRARIRSVVTQPTGHFS